MTKETSPPHLAGCGAVVNVLGLPELARFQTNLAEALYDPLKHDRDLSEYVNSDHLSNMVNTRRKHVKSFNCKTKLLEDNCLEGH